MLKQLCELCGTSGYEHDVIKFIESFLKENEIEYTIDKLGNIIAYVGDSPESIALCAHIDEVGFGVKGYTDEGMIKFASVGSVLEKILPSSRVVIGKDRINGIIGNKPKHLKAKGEKTELTFDDLFIDIGAKSRDDAKKYVKIGDPIYWESEYIEFGDNLIKAKALDDRVGVYTILKLLADKKYSFTACFNTREEIGLFGAKTVSQKLNIKKALILEVTTCADMPEIDVKTTKLGGGVALSVMDRGSVSDLSFNEKIESLAKKNKIPMQKKLTTTGGNDAGAVSYRSGGIKTAVLSVPGRYIHSPVSVISKNDLTAMYNLCEKILEDAYNE